MRWKRVGNDRPRWEDISAGVAGDQGAMAPVGAPVLSERSTPPTVPRVGRTGMEAPAGRPGRPTR